VIFRSHWCCALLCYQERSNLLSDLKPMRRNMLASLASGFLWSWSGRDSSYRSMLSSPFCLSSQPRPGNPNFAFGFPYSSCPIPSFLFATIVCLSLAYKSGSSSSGSGIVAASFISLWYWSINCWLTWTSGGASATSATNSRDWLPTSLRASHRNGFSKL
jgi:hypothetical protein